MLLFNLQHPPIINQLLSIEFVLQKKKRKKAKEKRKEKRKKNGGDHSGLWNQRTKHVLEKFSTNYQIPDCPVPWVQGPEQIPVRVPILTVPIPTAA